MVDQGLQCITERVLGVNRPCEPSLAQLDGAYEGPRSFRSAVGEREVRVLIPLANQLAQVPRAKIVLRDNLVPDIRVFLEVGCHEEAEEGVSIVPACVRNLRSDGVCFYRLQPDDVRVELIAAWKKETPSVVLRAFLDLIDANTPQIRKEAELC